MKPVIRGDRPMCSLVFNNLDCINSYCLPTAVQLADSCRSLFEFLENYPNCKKAYRIEIEPNETTQSCTVSLLFDPCAWYDEILKNNENKLDIARAYVLELRNEASKKTYIPPDEEPIQQRSYCRFPHSCNRLPGKCQFKEYCNRRPICKFIHPGDSIECSNGLHAKYYCHQDLVKRKNFIPYPCNWFCRDELVLKDLILSPNFVATARPEQTRDILLAPLDHISNINLCIDSYFWNIVIHDLMFSLSFYSIFVPVELIAINFGDWETRQSGDKFAIDCHGHVHFHLKQETFYSLIEANDNWKLPLSGRNCNPNDYKEEDAQLLEQNRLLGAENIFFHKRIQILHEDVCDLKFSMKLVLEKLDSLIKKE